jgi:predicted dehydrogenase
MSTAPKVWRVAFIGAGSIVKWAHVPNFAMVTNAESVAICDVNEERAALVAPDAGIPAVYGDYRRMLEEVRPDITVVATPNVFHKEMTLAALAVGSHVLCEKPLAPTLADAVEMFEAARLADRVLTVGTHYRFAPNMQTLRAQAKAGFFGKIYAIRTTWQRRSGIPGLGGWFTNRDLAAGGVLLDLGVHALDRALFLMDYPRPVSVTGMTFAEFGPRGKGAGGWGADAMMPPSTAGMPRFDVDDFAWAAVRFDTGTALLFQVAWASHFPELFSLELYGTEGGASLNQRDELELYTNLNGSDVNVTVPVQANAPSSYTVLAQNLVRHLDGDPTADIVTPEQALVAVQIVDAIGQSAYTGAEVRL